jgi:hypothetical protein
MGEVHRFFLKRSFHSTCFSMNRRYCVCVCVCEEVFASMKDRHNGGGVPVKKRYWNVIGQKREIQDTHGHAHTHVRVFWEGNSSRINIRKLKV